MKEKLKGKKTYSAAIGMLLTAITPMFSESGIDPSLIDAHMAWQAILAMTLRAGIAGAGKRKVEMPGS